MWKTTAKVLFHVGGAILLALLEIRAAFWVQPKLPVISLGSVIAAFSLVAAVVLLAGDFWLLPRILEKIEDKTEDFRWSRDPL